MRAAHRQLEQHRVQADEGRRPARGVTEPAGRPGDQRGGAEARDDRDRLEGPQPARESQGRGRVACKREQWAVGGVQEGPADERKHRVGGGFRGHVRIGVQAVQGSEASEAQVAEHILGDQRGTQQQNHVRRGDRRCERTHGQRSGRQQHQQIARAHDQREGLEAVAADAHAEALEGPRHPAGPAAAARRDVLRGSCGGAGGQQEDGRDHAEQAEGAQRPHGACSSPRAACRIGARRRRRGRLGAGCGDGGLYGLIVTSWRPASV